MKKSFLFKCYNQRLILKQRAKTSNSQTFKLLPPSISYGHFIKTALGSQNEAPKGNTAN